MRSTGHRGWGRSFLRMLGYPFRRLWRSGHRLDECYWHSLPELALFPSDRERKRALRRACWGLVGRWAWLLAAATAIVVSLVCTLVLRRYLGSLGLPMSQTAINLILMFPVTIGCSILGIWMMNRHVSFHLRRTLLDCGVPVCLGCGYHLIGAAGPVCPECGRAIDTRVIELNRSDLSEPEASAESGVDGSEQHRG